MKLNKIYALSFLLSSLGVGNAMDSNSFCESLYESLKPSGTIYMVVQSPYSFSYEQPQQPALPGFISPDSSKEEGQETEIRNMFQADSLRTLLSNTNFTVVEPFYLNDSQKEKN